MIPSLSSPVLPKLRHSLRTLQHSFRTISDETDAGERVSHLYPNTCFVAHLSIYRFARSLTTEAVVLDAGSGTGYGAHYLAEHGAKLVLGIDGSPRAVAFSRHYFFRENLQFRVMELESIESLADDYFDVIFSSNTLEHICGVHSFLSQAASKLKRNGKMIAAVPPIVSEAALHADIGNPYHLNIWSPRQWHHVLSMFFERVECFRHQYDGEHVLSLDDLPDDTNVFAWDFTFPSVSIGELQDHGGITAVFVADRPRKPGDVPAELTFIDDSFSRPPTINRREAREVESEPQIGAHEVQQARVDELERQLSLLLSSKSWRLTAPLRSIGSQVRRFAGRHATATATVPGERRRSR